MKDLKKLKIIFLTEPLNSPSTRFRILQFKSEFAKHNMDITVAPIPKKLILRINLFNSLPRYDVVVIQRKLFQRLQFFYLRIKSKFLFFDFDDAILFRDSNASDFHSGSRLGRFKYTAKKADLIIAGNEYLKELATKFNARVVVIPTGINTKLYAPRYTNDKDSPVTLGWIGSQPNLIYLKTLIEPVNKLYEVHKNIKIKIVCDDFIDGFACPVEKKIWVEGDEIADIQTFDIGLSPIIEDKWTKGKCALKLLQYMSCGIPSVSSNTAVTSKIIKNGVNGFLVSSQNDWFEKLKILVENYNMKKVMGANARQSLVGVYDEESIVAQYAALFQGACRESD